MILGAKPRYNTVEFRDVYLYAMPPIHEQRRLQLSVTLQRGTGRFEVMDNNRQVARGFILNQLKENKKAFILSFESKEKLEFKCEDVYKMLQERDYQYKDEFRSIHKVNPTFTEAQITWNNNWVTFLDGILQLHILRGTYDSVCQPYQLRRLTIDIKEHFNNKLLTTDNKSVMLANIFVNDLTTRCGGVVIEDIQLRKLPVHDEGTAALRILRFIPRFLSHTDICTAIEVYLQIVSENINKDAITVVGLFDSQKYSNVFEVMRDIYDDIPGLIVNYEDATGEKILEMRDYFLTDVDLVLVQNLAADENLRQMLYHVLPRDIFIISIEEPMANAPQLTLYNVVSTQNVNNSKIALVKWRPVDTTSATTVVTVRSELELSNLTATWMKLPQRHKLVIVSPYPTVPGLKDFVKDKRKDLDHNQIFLVMTSEKETLYHIPELELTYSVLKNSIWGGEYYIKWRENVSTVGGITLRSGAIGNLDTLRWFEQAESTESGIPVTVHYTAINNLDVKKATGISALYSQNKSSDASSYGMDFSGVTD
ncbi:uncharacterized protein LOC113227796, partial [Hyposmocoma kahamanoa]|uniref:uncharacterized protein LOC113227796 n=1 Tax=Hyposmocoma kahamanoa TaxID=1477025 RepID=UPI000E6DA074